MKEKDVFFIVSYTSVVLSPSLWADQARRRSLQSMRDAMFTNTTCSINPDMLIFYVGSN